MKKGVRYANEGRTEKYTIRYADGGDVQQIVKANLLVQDQEIVWLLKKPDGSGEQTVFIGSLNNCSVTLVQSEEEGKNDEI